MHPQQPERKHQTFHESAYPRGILDEEPQDLGSVYPLPYTPPHKRRQQRENPAGDYCTSNSTMTTTVRELARKAQFHSKLTAAIMETLYSKRRCGGL